MISRIGSIESDAAPRQGEQGGASPTPMLCKRDWVIDRAELSVAQQLVRRFHYAASGSNTAAFVHGLFPVGMWRNDCRGVAWWLPPTRTAAKSFAPENPGGVLALSRLVVIPDMPKNACTFLMRHSMRLIDRTRWPVFCSYACESQGHLGTIYLAALWRFVGWSKQQPLYMNGARHVSRKIGPKTRSHREMLDLGYQFAGKFRKRRFVHVAGVDR